MKVFKGKRILITGHTGFKGRWLLAWLKYLGAEVKGLSLPSEELHSFLDRDHYFGDIRSKEVVDKCMKEFRPLLVFHLAAKALVKDGFEDPYETFSTNYLGTLNMVEALRKSPETLGMVHVSTDKVYDSDSENLHHTVEGLKASDPYGLSKLQAEEMINCFRENSLLLGKKIVQCRSGNVIGGGDDSRFRLVPDIVRSLRGDGTLKIRNPESVRPYLYVLDTLNGYLLAGESILKQNSLKSDVYNFAPAPEEHLRTEELIQIVQSFYPSLRVDHVAGNFKETKILRVDSASSADLGWKMKVSLAQALERTLSWDLSPQTKTLDSYYKEIESFLSRF